MEAIGLILPPLIDIINRDIKNSQAQFIVAFIVCLFFGIAINFTNLQSGHWTVNGLLGSIALVFTSAQVIFHTYWNPLIKAQTKV